MNTTTTTMQPNITSTEAKLELMILNSQTNQLDCQRTKYV